jgi:hypothetical protein
MMPARLFQTLQAGLWDAHARELSKALKAERDLVLRGELRELASLAARMERAVEELADAAPRDRAKAEGDLREIRHAAARNLRLISAALEGMRSIRSKAGKSAAASFGYDRSGVALGPRPDRSGCRA